MIMTLVSLTVVVAFHAAGAVLVVALMVVPAATALLFTRSLSSTVLVAVVVALVGSQLGFWLAYLIDAATSPMMALLDGVIFLAVWLVTLVAGAGIAGQSSAQIFPARASGRGSSCWRGSRRRSLRLPWPRPAGSSLGRGG